MNEVWFDTVHCLYVDNRFTLLVGYPNKTGRAATDQFWKLQSHNFILHSLLLFQRGKGGSLSNNISGLKMEFVMVVYHDLNVITIIFYWVNIQPPRKSLGGSRILLGVSEWLGLKYPLRIRQHSSRYYLKIWGEIVSSECIGVFLRLTL